MTICLYKPKAEPQVLTPAEFSENIRYDRLMPVERIANLLECDPGKVDVLAFGKDYIFYSVFDCVAGVNPIGMEVFTALTGHACEDDEPLRGPLLVLCL
ncbi:hypothetical protein [Hymenobacter sp. UYCo722]|uniref:hypothetical protein n=1 Tax=Hymenobacter sp. UYCo722 TaxID=3156335 RepID=UPI003396B4FC